MNRLAHLTKLTSWKLDTPILIDLSRAILIERLEETTLPLEPPKTFTARTRLVLRGIDNVHVNEMPEAIEKLAEVDELAAQAEDPAL